MHKGALIYKAFRTGNNPFHEAAIKGFVNCVKIIFKTDPHVLNSANKDGVIKILYFGWFIAVMTA